MQSMSLALFEIESFWTSFNSDSIQFADNPVQSHLKGLVYGIVEKIYRGEIYMWGVEKVTSGIFVPIVGAAGSFQFQDSLDEHFIWFLVKFHYVR